MNQIPLEVQKMAVVGRLAASVIHDLNNILTVIQLNAGMLEIEGGNSKDGAKLIEEINSACAYASRLTRGVLDVSRRPDRTTGSFELGKVLAGMAPLLGVLAGRKTVLKTDYPDEKIWLEGSSVEFQQIMLNLVANAVESQPRNGIEIKACRKATKEGRAIIEMSVIDTGHGISPEIQARIFEDFFTTKEEGRGTGLGLSIVHEIVTKRGGTLEVESALDVGTAFRFTFPETCSPDEEASLSYGSPMKRGHGESILLVEDDSGVRALCRQILENEGYRIWAAASGDLARGVWSMHRQEIDLLLTDLVLPGSLSGEELAEIFAREKPGLRILYTSGRAGPPSACDGQANRKFLPKPYRPEELVSTVEALLAGKINPGPASAG